MADIESNRNPIIDEEKKKRFENIAIRRLVRKLDWQLIPFMCLLEIGSYINRISIGYVQAMGIRNDLHLSQVELAWAISLFFLAYLIFAIPSTILMRYLGLTSYLSLSMLAWGGITVGMAFVRNAQQLLTVRFLLGVAQAGYFPGIIIYISFWYRKRDQTMRIAIVFGAAVISSALGAILASAFEQMDGIGGLNGWQWMFLLPGLPMIPLGIITCFFLNNIPDTVQWLDGTEKQHLANLLRCDAGIDDRENARVSWPQVRHAFTDWRIYLYVLIGMGNLSLIKYITTYLPVLVQNMSDWETKVHLMTAPPYVFAFVCCLLAGYSSSRKNEHACHLIFCLSVALLGSILMLTLINHSKVAIYVSICIACCGFFSAFPLILSWLTTNVDGHTKRTVAIGFFMGMAQIGGVILPLVDYDEFSSRRDTLICIGSMSGSLVVTIILFVCLWLTSCQQKNSFPRKCDLETTDLEKYPKQKRQVWRQILLVKTKQTGSRFDPKYVLRSVLEPVVLAE